MSILTEQEMELMTRLCQTNGIVRGADISPNSNRILKSITEKFRSANCHEYPWHPLGGDYYGSTFHQGFAYEDRRYLGQLHHIYSIIENAEWNEMVNGIQYWRMVEKHSELVITDVGSRHSRGADGGIDFYGLTDDAGVITAHVGQVKKENTVSISQMRDLLGTCYLIKQSDEFRRRYASDLEEVAAIHNVRGYFVTTGKFSSQAKHLADLSTQSGGYHIRLINGLEYAKIIASNDPFYNEKRTRDEIVERLFEDIED